MEERINFREFYRKLVDRCELDPKTAAKLLRNILRVLQGGKDGQDPVEDGAGEGRRD